MDGLNWGTYNSGCWHHSGNVLKSCIRSFATGGMHAVHAIVRVRPKTGHTGQLDDPVCTNHTLCSECM